MFNHVFLLNTMLFLLFQMLQRIADETKLNCKYLVLQSHLEAMLKKSVTLISNTSKTKSQSSSEIKHSKERCLTDFISLQRLHSRGFDIPLFLRLSLARLAAMPWPRPQAAAAGHVLSRCCMPTAVNAAPTSLTSCLRHPKPCPG
jgi:hypothetical protein